MRTLIKMILHGVASGRVPSTPDVLQMLRELNQAERRLSGPAKARHPRSLAPGKAVETQEGSGTSG